MVDAEWRMTRAFARHVRRRLVRALARITNAIRVVSLAASRWTWWAERQGSPLGRAKYEADNRRTNLTRFGQVAGKQCAPVGSQVEGERGPEGCDCC